MAELRALEAQEAGITAAQVVIAPREKLTVGKAVMFIAGLGAVGYFLVFSDKSPFEALSSDPEKKAKRSPKEGAEAHEILNQIRYGEMEDVEEQKKSTIQMQKPTTPTSSGFLDVALSRASILGGK